MLLSANPPTEQADEIRPWTTASPVDTWPPKIIGRHPPCAEIIRAEVETGLSEEEDAVFDTAHAQVLGSLAASGTAVLVIATALVAFGYVRDCSGQHAGAGPGATTVAHIQAALAAETSPPSEAVTQRPGRHRSSTYQYPALLLGLRPATP